MRDHPVDRILETAAVEIRTLDVAIRARVLRAIVGGVRRGDTVPAILVAVRRVLDRYAPAVADAVADARLAAWVRGTADIARTVKPSVLAALAGPEPDVSPVVARRIRRVSADHPFVGAAADWLARRRIVTADQAEMIGDSMTWDAFRIGTANDEKIVTRVRDLLAEQIVEGPSLRDFKRKAKRVVGDEATAGDLEATFRTGVRRAYAEAQRKMTDNPVVRAVLPYRVYLAVHDGRTRPQHRLLETLGLNGTNVYRTDDPFWDYFEPPWEWNCRCEAPYITIERAAEMGVREAQEWLIGIEPPEQVEWRIDDVPFRPSYVLVA